MAAYLIGIETERCKTCGAEAMVHLYNTFNALTGAYCRRHGNIELKAAHERDRSRMDEERKGRP